MSAKETRTEFQVSSVLFGDMDHHLGARESFLNPNFLHLTLPGLSTARNNNQYVLVSQVNGIISEISETLESVCSAGVTAPVPHYFLFADAAFTDHGYRTD